MKFIVLAVLSCALMLEASPRQKRSIPFLGQGIQVAKALRKQFMGLGGQNQGNDNFANGFGGDQDDDGLSGVGQDQGNPLEQGLQTGTGLMNEGARNFGLDGVGLGGESQSNGYRRGRNHAAQNYNQGANGARGQSAHNRGANEFHNVGQHHNKVTSVTQSENDGSHNIGGSQAHDVGGQTASQFNKNQNGAAQAGNDFAQGEQQSDIIS